MHPQLQKLLTCVELEEKEQATRYALDQAHTLKQLKSEGLALHPLIVTRKNFGYADYPEISFRLAFPPETNLFRDGAAIECFISGEEPVKGVLISLEGKTGEFRLFNSINRCSGYLNRFMARPYLQMSMHQQPALPFLLKTVP